MFNIYFLVLSVVHYGHKELGWRCKTLIRSLTSIKQGDETYLLVDSFIHYKAFLYKQQMKWMFNQ